ncbi:MAG: hypothetical protein RMM17_02925 [Acidobacteriota bacterium]|nr:hypothetical protein [Blastocatellia bacterium]MDW8411621.1 hypothetical protein [Acidobacteriota bacterium]
MQQIEREIEAIRDELSRNSGAKADSYDILPLELPETWPQAIKAYHALRRDRHGRIFFQFIFCDGLLYSPFSVDGLERLLSVCFANERLRLTAAQTAEVVLMLSRPEYGINLIESVEELSQPNRSALERVYGLKDLSPQLVKLDENDYKLTFWTFHLRRGTLKRWLVYIPAGGGRIRISEDVAIELSQLQQEEA